ncbi:MAG: hypothetical protein ACRCU6_02690 [Fusobacteriaceae bacterium]
MIEMVIYERMNETLKILEEVQEPIDLLKNSNENLDISLENSKKISIIIKKMVLLGKDYAVQSFQLIFGESFNNISNLPLLLDQINLYSGLDIDMDNLNNSKILTAKIFFENMEGFIQKKESRFFLNLKNFDLDFYLFYRGNVLKNESLPLGGYTLFKIIENNSLRSDKLTSFIDDYLSCYLNFFKKELGRKKIDTLIINCSPQKYILKEIFREGEEYSAEYLKKIIKNYENFPLKKIETELLLCNMKIIICFLDFFSIKKFIILKDLGKNILAKEYFFSEFKKEVSSKLWKITLNSVRNLLLKYHIPCEHPIFISELSSKLFKVLEHYHNLDLSYERQLIIAGYLYDTGKFVEFKNSYQHSCYIVKNSWIFALTEKEVRDIAFLIHAQTDDISLYELCALNIPRAKLVKLLKLAAILKIATALDYSKKQKITSCQFNLVKDELEILLEVQEDFFMENYKLKKQTGIFKDIFNLDINLKINRRYYGD